MQDPMSVTENPRLYKTLLGGGIITTFIMTIATILLWGNLFFDEIFDEGQTVLVILVTYLLLSLKEQRENEVGALFSYGRALIAVPSGLHFAPFGLMQLRKGPRTAQEFQCPGEPEKVQKTDDKVPLEPEMVRPIRIVTGGSNANTKGDILDTRMTLILSFFVRWAVTDVLLYASYYGDTSQIEKQVRDIAEAVLAEIAVGHSPASFIAALPDINKRLTKEIAQRFKDSGVRIISTRLISPDISHEVSTALADIPKARAETEQVKIRAEGKKVDLTKVGEGDGAARLAMLSAEAKGQKAIMDALGVKGDAVLASEAVGKVLTQTDVLVMGQSGTADAMGLVKAAQSALNSGVKKGASS